MRSGKPWIKRILITAGIIAVVGVGMHWAMERGHSELEHGRTEFAQPKSVNGVNDWGESIGHHERGMGGEEREHERWHAGVAVGGIIIAGGLLYLIRRRMRSGGRFAANVTPMISSNSDFLDQWEQEQLHKKETN